VGRRNLHDAAALLRGAPARSSCVSGAPGLGGIIQPVLFGSINIGFVTWITDY
jgi:hypothetical protein